jgi:hypothetical protein
MLTASSGSISSPGQPAAFRRRRRTDRSARASYLDDLGRWDRLVDLVVLLAGPPIVPRLDSPASANRSWRRTELNTSINTPARRQDER